MNKLFLAECRRFSRWALAFGIVHIGILLFARQLIDPLQQREEMYIAVGGGYAMIGVLVGAYQASSYARLNQWIALLHRPLAPWRILLAIAAGSAVMLTAATLLPLLFLLLIHHTTGTSPVDLRHILLMISATLLAVTGLVGGIYAVVAPRRYGWLVLIPAFLPFASMAAGWRTLVMQLVVLAGVLLLSIIAFRPDRLEPPRRPLALAGTAMAAAMGAYVLIVVVGGLAFQMGWIATGTHPLNSSPPKGGTVEAIRTDGASLLEAGLAGLQGEQVDIWRQQIRMSEVFALPYTTYALPQRGELTNSTPLQFMDKERGIRWTFSHDDMRFHGLKLEDRSVTEAMRQAEPFPSPPLPVGEVWMIAGGNAYRFSAEAGVVERRLTLPQGETITADPAMIGDVLAVTSDKALRLYDARIATADMPVAPQQLASIPLPGPVGNLSRTDMIELLDGHLVSFTYARGAIDEPQQAWQQIVQLNHQGESKVVATRQLRPDFPAALRYLPYWTSPVLQPVRAFVENLGGGSPPNMLRAPISIPLHIRLISLLLAAVAAAAVWLRAQQRGLARRDSVIWTAATMLLGPPMAVAFALIQPAPTAA